MRSMWWTCLSQDFPKQISIQDICWLCIKIGRSATSWPLNLWVRNCWRELMRRNLLTLVIKVEISSEMQEQVICFLLLLLLIKSIILSLPIANLICSTCHIGDHLLSGSELWEISMLDKNLPLTMGNWIITNFCWDMAFVSRTTLIVCSCCHSILKISLKFSTKT